MMGKRQNITPFFTDQKLLLKSMTPEKKINLTLSLYYSAKKFKYFAFKNQHPDWTEDKILKKLREVFLYART